MKRIMNESLQEVELIVQGEVQGVGYRQYVAKIGRKLNLVGCVKNLEDGTIQIRCKGEEKKINDFKEQINKKKPEKAPLVEVEKIISDSLLKQGTIKQTTFQVIPGDTNSEILEGNMTGINYLNLFRKDTNENFARMDENLNLFRTETKASFERMDENLNLFRTETKANFERMDEKYDKISQAMYAVVEEIEERNKTFENRMEKTEKSIESLLKILVEKKS